MLTSNDPRQCREGIIISCGVALGLIIWAVFGKLTGLVFLAVLAAIAVVRHAIMKDNAATAHGADAGQLLPQFHQLGQQPVQPDRPANAPHRPYPPVYQSPSAAPVTGRPAPWLPVAAVVAVSLIAVSVVLALHPWQSGHPSEPSASTTSTDLSTSSAPSMTSAVAPALTFDNKRDFITDYYRELPAQPMNAWNKLDAGYQQRSGLSDYLNYWSSIRSVTVLSVEPLGRESLVANLQYVGNNGQAQTERRWFRVHSVGGALLISDSEIVGQ